MWSRSNSRLGVSGVMYPVLTGMLCCESRASFSSKEEYGAGMFTTKDPLKWQTVPLGKSVNAFAL